MDAKELTPWAVLTTIILPTGGVALRALYRSLVTEPQQGLREQLAQLKLERQEEKQTLLSQVTQLQSELKTQQKEFWQLGLEHAKLSAKYERLRGSSSTPPAT